MFSSSMETLKDPSFASEQNPSPKQEDTHPLLFHFPSQFYDKHELPLNHQIMYQNQLLYVGNDHKSHEQQVTTKGNLFGREIEEKKLDLPQHPQQNPSVTRRRNLGVIPRRRAGKKDRHSKICTAQGIRDRRMRLSLQVARKFFDLQDMLGYDKASKTIEWLFTKSKKAIKELTKNIHPQQANYNLCNSDARSESFLSECEVMSGIEESSNKDIKDGVDPLQTLVPGEKTPERLACKPNSKESREKARARARCRTREKMMVRFSGQWCESSPNLTEELGFSNTPFEGMDKDQDSTLLHQDRILTYGVDYNNSLEHQSADAGTIEKLLGIPTTSTSYMDPNTSFLGFLGSWDQVTLAGNPNSIYSANP